MQDLAGKHFPCPRICRIRLEETDTWRISVEKNSRTVLSTTVYPFCKMSEQRETEKGNMDGYFIVVFEGNNGPGMVAGKADLGLARLNNVSALWDIRTVPSHLISGPGMIRAGREGSRI